MIAGTGIDLVEIDRIRRLADRYGERFLGRVFTPGELARCRRRRNWWPCLAARFAAKEAAMKSLGIGLGSAAWRDIEVTSGPGGRPFLRVYGSAAERAAMLGVDRFWLSLSHSEHYAVAQVIAEGGARFAEAEGGNADAHRDR